MEDDLFVLVPNCASAILCLIQLLLVVLYPTKKVAVNQDELLDKDAIA